MSPVLATSSTAIAWVIVTILVLGFVVFAILNHLAARPELGSEVEMAPNRKPYDDDETLEGPRLERMQILAVLLLIVLVVGLPLYWVFEPSRQAGAREFRDRQFVSWGHKLFDTTANGGFNCAGCHGSIDNPAGASWPWTLTDPNTGKVRTVQWKAPALNSVLSRYSEDEVRYIITYGRTFSPMSAWGTDGGGPMNIQQIDTLVAFLKSRQIPREGCAPGENDPKVCPSGHLPKAEQAKISDAATLAAKKLVAEGKYATEREAMGEALFNLDLNSGAYSCARCHTPGWSYGEPGVAGQGAFGWNLTGGSVNAHFPNKADLIAFIKSGSEDGKRYGTQGQGSGRMPGFGQMLTDEQIDLIAEYLRTKL